MKAITVKFHGPTNHRPAYYKAFDSDGNKASVKASELPDSRYYGCGYRSAAVALCSKMKWNDQDLFEGTVKGARVYTFADAKNRVETIDFPFYVKGK